jgi:Spy/CpxP family protein refolding chaperone
MKLARIVLVLALFGLISVGTIVGQDKAKARGQLPQGWAKLGLSDEQKQKVYEVQNKFKAKIEDLQKQIEQAREQQRKEELAILTDAQKKKLKEMMSEKIGEKP